MDTPVRPGDILLQKYRVEHVLGQGGMGMVVAARHMELGELYAIKFLLPGALTSREAVERFLREARASARLKSEHVAKVHDVGRIESGAPYMVMEHLTGIDLKALLRQRGPMPPDDAVRVLLQACDAIGEAHALGIIHRDLKPANLFLAHRPNGVPSVKVLDFGISKQVTEAGATADITRTGQILGSPLYMAPEQSIRMKDADARSDIWALGVILYELVVGASPFQADALPEIIARILQVTPDPPSRVRAGIPAWLDAVVMRCLEKEPARRFASVGELAAALAARGEAQAASSRSSAPTAPASAPTAPASWSVSRPSLPSWGSSLPHAAAQPSSAASALSNTGSAWGKTSVWQRPQRRGRLAALGAGVALAIAALGACGVWLARSMAPDALVAQEAARTALAAAEKAASALPATPPSPPSAAGEPAPGSAGLVHPNAEGTAGESAGGEAKAASPSAKAKTKAKTAAPPAARTSQPATKYEGVF